jgi:hypothetical protein
VSEGAGGRGERGEKSWGRVQGERVMRQSMRENQQGGIHVLRWDKNKESLSSTLHQKFPETFPKTESPPIPEKPPASDKGYYFEFFQNYSRV